jgi:hypothetical protein
MPSLQRTAAYAELSVDNPGSDASTREGAFSKYRQARQEGARGIIDPGVSRNR